MTISTTLLFILATSNFALANVVVKDTLVFGDGTKQITAIVQGPVGLQGAKGDTGAKGDNSTVTLESICAAITAANAPLPAFCEPTYSVTTFVSGGKGSINQSGVVQVYRGQTQNFIVTPDNDWKISTVTGCGGSLLGNIYTTGVITSACTVTANFSATSQFTNNNDYTINDNFTSLIWQSLTGSMIIEWEVAQNYCSTLSLGGVNSGWRLPSVQELQSLICGAGHPAWIYNGCDGSNSNNPSGTTPNTWLDSQGFTTFAGKYWSSTKFPGSEYAYNMNLGDGYYAENLGQYVRCVRNGP